MQYCNISIPTPGRTTILEDDIDIYNNLSREPSTDLNRIRNTKDTFLFSDSPSAVFVESMSGCVETK